MNLLDMHQVLSILEMIGVVAFSISGAMVAIDKKLDLFGVIFVSVMTSLGGGVTRDILIGKLPPQMFENYKCIAISVTTSILVFIVVYVTREYYRKNVKTIETINNVFDAIGLGVFSIFGIQIAINTGFGYNKFLLVFLGMITGVGGGLIRDIIVGRTPMIFSKYIYAVAAILGGISYLICQALGTSEGISTMAGILVIFVIRMLSTYYKWNLPKIPLK